MDHIVRLDIEIRSTLVLLTTGPQVTFPSWNGRELCAAGWAREVRCRCSCLPSPQSPLCKFSNRQLLGPVHTPYGNARQRTVTHDGTLTCVQSVRWRTSTYDVRTGR